MTIQQVSRRSASSPPAKSQRPSYTHWRRRRPQARARAADSSPPTRWRWPSRCSASHPPDRRWSPPRTGASGRREGVRRTGDGRCCAAASSERDHHQARPGERDRRGRHERRLDQRCFASARRRQGNRHPLQIDDFDPISERTPLSCDLQPGGRYVARTCTRRDVPLCSSERAKSASERRRRPHRTNHRRACPGGAGDTPAARRTPARQTRSSPRAASRSCAVTSHRRLRVKPPATNVAATSGRPASSTEGRPRWPRCSAKD